VTLAAAYFGTSATVISGNMYISVSCSYSSKEASMRTKDTTEGFANLAASIAFLIAEMKGITEMSFMFLISA
jgi:hypothetical protein